jgi:hypothetical protein
MDIIQTVLMYVKTWMIVHGFEKLKRVGMFCPSREFQTLIKFVYAYKYVSLWEIFFSASIINVTNDIHYFLPLF